MTQVPVKNSHSRTKPYSILALYCIIPAPSTSKVACNGNGRCRWLKPTKAAAAHPPLQDGGSGRKWRRGRAPQTRGVLDVKKVGKALSRLPDGGTFFGCRKAHFWFPLL